MEQDKKHDIDQFLILKLGNDEYGIDIKKVTTIIEKNLKISRIPKTSDYIKGVINLRGEIIPITNLRVRFGMKEIEDTEERRIVITKIEDIIMGFEVDAVSEVVRLNNNDIESVAGLLNSKTEDYVEAIGKIDARIITILDLKKLIKYSDIICEDR